MTDDLTPELIELFKNTTPSDPIEITYKNGVKSIYSRSLLTDFYGADNVDYITDLQTGQVIPDPTKNKKHSPFLRLLKKIRTMMI